MENIYGKYIELLDLMFEKYKPQKTFEKKYIQKLFYFMEKEGIDINLKYSIHYYGPYSQKLDDIIYYLYSEDYITMNTKNSVHIIAKGDITNEEKYLSEEENKIAVGVIEFFEDKTSDEIEKYSIIDYMANSTMKHKDINSVMQILNKYNKDRYNRADVQNTLERLEILDVVRA